MARTTINEVTELDGDSGELIVHLKDLFGVSPDKLTLSMANVRRLVIQQLADEWVRQYGQRIFDKISLDDVSAAMREELAKRFVGTHL